jgi:uncharacterized protein
MTLLAQGYAFTLHKTQVVALAQAFLWLPRSRTLVASDLHFEKGSAYAAMGALLPPFDTSETRQRLVSVIDQLKPELLITLGDSFHDVDADARLHPDDKDSLRAISLATPTVWIEGNHDPEVPSWLEGKRCARMEHDGLIFTHEPRGAELGEVAGHLHPCARLTGKSGRSVRRRCFVTDGQVLVMPAAGAFAGGLNVRDAVFEGLFKKPPTALVAGGTQRAPTQVRAIAVSNLDVGG